MILSIEGAVAGGSLSLNDGYDVIATWSGDSDVSRAEDLLPAIVTMLESVGRLRSDLTRLAVSAGPGSFTGIRIGLATAFGLAAGLAIPVTSVSVLLAMARGSGSRNVTAAVPMGRASICIQRFEDNNPVSEPQTLPASEFVELIQSSAEAFALHSTLVSAAPDAARVFDMGVNLARHIGLVAQREPGRHEPPLFVAKSF